MQPRCQLCVAQHAGLLLRCKSVHSALMMVNNTGQGVCVMPSRAAHKRAARITLKNSCLLRLLPIPQSHVSLPSTCKYNQPKVSNVPGHRAEALCHLSRGTHRDERTLTTSLVTSTACLATRYAVPRTTSPACRQPCSSWTWTCRHQRVQSLQCRGCSAVNATANAATRRDFQTHLERAVSLPHAGVRAQRQRLSQLARVPAGLQLGCRRQPDMYGSHMQLYMPCQVDEVGDAVSFH